MTKRALLVALLFSLYMPSSHEALAESPTLHTISDAINEQLTHNRTGKTVEPVLVTTPVQAKPKAEVKAKSISVSATFYTAYCEGCSGITATGDDVRNTIYADGYRVIAVDPRQIPLRSIVRVTLADGTTFDAIASDKGGAIKGAKIDVLVASKSEAYRLGRQQATVTILND